MKTESLDQSVERSTPSEKTEVDIFNEALGRSISPEMAASLLAKMAESRLNISFTPRKSIYFTVTESEIDMYAQLGWFSTIFLSIFGVLLGVAAGCVLALFQVGLPNNAFIALSVSAWITGIFSLIFLALAILFIIMQYKNKKSWKLD